MCVNESRVFIEFSPIIKDEKNREMYTSHNIEKNENVYFVRENKLTVFNKEKSLIYRERNAQKIEIFDFFYCFKAAEEFLECFLYSH